MNESKWVKILPSLLAVLIGLLGGWYLLFLNNPIDSVGGIFTIMKGGFSDGISGLGIWFYTATPILMTGLSVGFAMKTGLFNIGSSGQFTVGAFVAIFVGVRWTFLPPVLHTIVAILLGTLAGAFFGFIVGFLKAFFKVNEVISGIMLNYIGMLLVNLLIKSTIYNPNYNRSADVAKSATIPANFLSEILPGSKLSIGFFIAVLVVVLIGFILKRTTMGYELKTTGRNTFAGLYAGMNDRKNVILSMTISGALSGLGGALMFLSDFSDHIVVAENVLQQGFTGISVSLLGMNDPIGILVAALFIAHITVGGNYLQLYGYTPEVVNMIIAIIVYCGALVLPIRMFIQRIIRKKKGIVKTEGMV